MLDLRQGCREVLGTDVILAGEVDDVTGLNAVDIAVNKGIGIQALDIQHGLVHRSTGRFGRCSNLPQGVIPVDHVLGTRPGCRRGIGTEIPIGHFARSKPGFLDIYPGATSRRRVLGLFSAVVWQRSPLHFRDPLGGGHHGGSRVKEGRIHQYGVFTQQAAGRPARLNNKVQIRFQHRIIGRDGNGTASLSVYRNVKLDTGKEVGALHAHTLKILAGGEADANFIGVQTTGIQQINLCLQRFIEKRLQLELTQAKRERRAGMNTPQRKHHSSKLTSHTPTPYYFSR